MSDILAPAVCGLEGDAEAEKLTCEGEVVAEAGLDDSGGFLVCAS